jgi:ABC-type lipoprotein release transport system permease subunit
VELGLRTLARRWGRAALTSLGVAAVIAVYLGVSGGVGSAEQEIQSPFEGTGVRIIVQQPLEGYSDAEAFPALASLLDASVAEAILATPGVDPLESSSVLFMPLTRVASPGEPPAVLAVGIEPGHENAFLEGLPAQDGRATLSGATSAILGPRAARYYAAGEGIETLTAGAMLEIGGEEFEVVGLLEPGSALTDRSILLPLTTAQRLFVRPGVVSAIVLHMENPSSAGPAAADLREQFPDLQVIGGQDDALPEPPAQEVGGEVGQFFDALRAMVLLVAVLMISIVMVINVADQRRQIGILRAMGAGRGLIAGLVLAQSVLLSVAGTLLAWPIYALVTLSLRSALAEANIEIMLADLLPSWTRMFITALLVGGLASLWPAWQAARVAPLEALRAE